MIIGGRLEGGEIKINKNFNYAYVQLDDTIYYIAQGAVKSITIVDTKKTGNIMLGSLLFGYTGAISGQNKQEFFGTLNSEKLFSNS